MRYPPAGQGKFGSVSLPAMADPWQSATQKQQEAAEPEWATNLEFQFGQLPPDPAWVRRYCSQGRIVRSAMIGEMYPRETLQVQDQIMDQFDRQCGTSVQFQFGQAKGAWSPSGQIDAPSSDIPKYLIGGVVGAIAGFFAAKHFGRR